MFKHTLKKLFLEKPNCYYFWFFTIIVWLGIPFLLYSFIKEYFDKNIFGILLVIGICYLFYIIGVYQQELERSFGRFLKKYKLKYYPDGEFLSNEKHSIFNAGHRTMLSEYYRDKDKNIEIFFLKAYTLIQIEVDQRKTSYVPFTVFKININRSYPFAQAIAKHFEARILHFAQPKNFHSESNEFNKKYFLNANKASEAFYVFNPHLMNEMLKSKTKYSVEVNDKYLAIFLRQEIDEIQNGAEILQYLERLKNTLE